MTVRRRSLPEGWYPQDSKISAAAIDECAARAAEHGLIGPNPEALSAMAPHASWYYSGTLAAAAIASLSGDAETVIVFGGHLPPGGAPLAAFEDAFETPFGPAASDAELLESLSRRIEFERDDYADNTVEIQLPFVKRYFPNARVVWLRMPASIEAYSIGRAAGESVLALGRRAVALGSTDLTHYGPSYDFSPKGHGPAAVEWVRDVNDRRFIDALLDSDPDRAVSIAVSDSAACSPGAALAAMGFAHVLGAADARLIGYATSADVRPSSSFVGYAAISWSKR